METSRKLIRKQSLEKLYGILAANRRVYAPVKKKDGTVEYRYNPGHEAVTMDHIRSVLSVKNIVFPKTENLFLYESTKAETTMKEIDTAQIPEVVLWGTHPATMQPLMP